MNEIVKYLTGNFVDYNNEVHDITICFISKASDQEILAEIHSPIMPVREAYLGYAIKNVKDASDLEFAKKIAYNRAQSFGPVLYSTRYGVIKDQVINDIMAQELNYIQSHPGKFIKGYNDKEQKVLFEKDTQNAYSKLQPYERSIVDSIRNGLDIDKYIKLANDLSKCQRKIKEA